MQCLNSTLMTALCKQSREARAKVEFEHTAHNYKR